MMSGSWSRRLLSKPLCLPTLPLPMPCCVSRSGCLLDVAFFFSVSVCLSVSTGVLSGCVWGISLHVYDCVCVCLCCTWVTVSVCVRAHTHVGMCMYISVCVPEYLCYIVMSSSSLQLSEDQSHQATILVRHWTLPI